MPFWPRNLALLLSLFIAGCGEKIAPSGAVDDSGGAIQRETCASDDAYTPFTHGMSSSNQGLTVAIESEPPVPSPGEMSTWKLTVTDESGAPVPAGTRVSVKCLMTHSSSSHGCPAIHVEELGNGVYEATPVIFIMQGHWHVDFGIGTSYVPIELCVE